MTVSSQNSINLTAIRYLEAQSVQVGMWRHNLGKAYQITRVSDETLRIVRIWFAEEGSGEFSHCFDKDQVLKVSWDIQRKTTTK